MSSKVIKTILIRSSFKKKKLTLLKYLITLFSICIPFHECHSQENSITQKIIKADLKSYSKKSFIADALETSGSAIVTIDTQRRVVNQHTNILPPKNFLDPYFERLFEIPNINLPRSRVERGQGSGIIFSSEGLVITNAHVVANSDKLIVGIPDGRRVLGKVIGQDYLTDLAVIKLSNPGPWPKAVIGNSDKIDVGDWAIAVGNPYGLEKTVTLGIISNINRNVSQLGISNNRINLIQTDAAINPGNSGGPLLNSDGEVIGINTLIHSSPGAGLGFAIPINQAISIANQLTLNGKVIHPMIGVSLSYTDLKEDSLEKDYSEGALIVYVLPGSPAENKGLRVNDIIIEVNQKEVKNPKDVVDAISRNGIKNSMRFKIKRNKLLFFVSIKPSDFETLKNPY